MKYQARVSDLYICRLDFYNIFVLLTEKDDKNKADNGFYKIYKTTGKLSENQKKLQKIDERKIITGRCVDVDKKRNY